MLLYLDDLEFNRAVKCAYIITHTQCSYILDALECKRAVKWLCDYIVTQCSRPPQAHSKDLHSSIVAAFQVPSSSIPGT